MARGDLRNPEKAAEYLENAGYEKVRVIDCDEPKISHRGGGDGSWEDCVADQNDWILQERQGCCIEESRRKPSTNYCPNCGTGINGTVTYVHSEEKSFLNAEQESRTLEYSMS